MASTKIGVVKAAALNTLSEADDLDGVFVTADKEPERRIEYVWIYKARAKREFRLIGPQPAPQDEMVSVYLRVVSIRDTRTAAEARALEIFEAAETALRAEPTLEGTAFFHHIEELDVEPLLFDQKWGCHVLATLEAKARI
jgi:hypothetical protein